MDIAGRDFDREVLECNLSVFACFVTRWCHSCYPMCLFAEELAKEYDRGLKFVKVDIEKSPEIAERYHVTAVPTILLFHNSQPVKRLLGFQERRLLRSLLNSAIAEEEMLRGELAIETGRKLPEPAVEKYEAHRNE